MDEGSFANFLLRSFIFLDLGMMGDSLRKSDGGEALFSRERGKCPAEKIYETSHAAQAAGFLPLLGKYQSLTSESSSLFDA